MPKRYLVDPALVDPALVAAVLGLGREAILYGPGMLGRLIDTFVAAQLRADLAVSPLGPRLYHSREEHGRREIDLLVETANGTLIGIEVKASATATASDARHLAWLRDGLDALDVIGRTPSLPRAGSPGLSIRQRPLSALRWRSLTIYAAL